MIKDILVHLDGTRDDEWRIAHAEVTARQFGASIIGLFLNRLLAGAMPVEAGYVGAEILGQLLQQAREDGDKVEKALDERLEKTGLPHGICRIDAFFDEIPGAAAKVARETDLSVVLRPYTMEGGQRWLGLAEGVLFGAGRSVLVVPEGKPVHATVENVAVAWNSSREAAHALAEAMPFLKMAQGVTIIMVDTEETDRKPGAGIVRHLERHGVQAHTCAVKSGDRRVSQVILEQAEKCGADLLVTGAYGHARIREWIIGGVTRDLLHAAPIPLLLAH